MGRFADQRGGCTGGMCPSSAEPPYYLFTSFMLLKVCSGSMRDSIDIGSRIMSFALMSI